MYLSDRHSVTFHEGEYYVFLAVSYAPRPVRDMAVSDISALGGGALQVSQLTIDESRKTFIRNIAK